MRLFYLHLIEGDNLVNASLQNRIHELKIGVQRGDILDRNGELLPNTAHRRLSVVIFLRQIENKEQAVLQLAEFCHRQPEYVLNLLGNHATTAFVFETGIEQVRAKKLAEAKIPGVVVIREKSGIVAVLRHICWGTLILSIIRKLVGSNILMMI